MPHTQMAGSGVSFQLALKFRRDASSRNFVLLLLSESKVFGSSGSAAFPSVQFSSTSHRVPADDPGSRQVRSILPARNHIQKIRIALEVDHQGAQRCTTELLVRP